MGLRCEFQSGWGHGCLSVVSVFCCHVEVYAMGRFLIQSIPAECSGSVCDSEASLMRRPAMGCVRHGKKKLRSEISCNSLNFKTASAY